MALERLEVPFQIKAEDIDEEGVFSGWASLFDQEPDSHRDLVARGAFRDTVAKGGRNGTGIMMSWQHKIHDIPPGVWIEIREDPKGLYVKGQLDLNTQLGRDIHSIMRLGVEKGTWRFSLSIGYDAIEEEFQKIRIGDGGNEIRVRLLKIIELWEIGIVNFPAKLGATVLDVKQIDIEQIKNMTEREFENFLRESCGCSKAAAQHIVSWRKPFLREAEEAKILEKKEAISPIVETVKQIRKKFQMGVMLNGILGPLKF